MDVEKIIIKRPATQISQTLMNITRLSEMAGEKEAIAVITAGVVLTRKIYHAGITRGLLASDGIKIEFYTSSGKKN